MLILPGMRAFTKVLWITAFLVATFCWMVLFQHGFTWQGFTTGAREELRAMVTRLAGDGKK
jgi:hypothetical protein